jgi:hypothetical protein
MDRDDRLALRPHVAEVITAFISVVVGLPDEEVTSLKTGGILADLAIAAIEQAGYRIVRDN